LNEKKLARSQVIEIEHQFWGGNVGCAGLIMGEEVRSQLKNVDCGEMLFLPPDAVDNQGRMLDDVTLAQLSKELKTLARADAHGPLELAQILRNRE
jgi:NifB/MoaA-like Fe-S oxidoreductase